MSGFSWRSCQKTRYCHAASANACTNKTKINILKGSCIYTEELQLPADLHRSTKEWRTTSVFPIYMYIYIYDSPCLWWSNGGRQFRSNWSAHSVQPTCLLSCRSLGWVSAFRFENLCPFTALPQLQNINIYILTDIYNIYFNWNIYKDI